MQNSRVWWCVWVMAVVSCMGLVTAAQAQVNVSVEVRQPGVYGRVDIGGLPAPRVVLPRPVVIEASPARVVEPVYLWVPAQHRRDWRRHCGRYGACGAPVYFVQDSWYQEHVHRGPGRHGEQGERGRHEGRGHGEHGRHEGHRD
jgi:hypothetical protein